MFRWCRMVANHPTLWTTSSVAAAGQDQGCKRESRA